jgi:hypothetical protein
VLAPGYRGNGQTPSWSTRTRRNVTRTSDAAARVAQPEPVHAGSGPRVREQADRISKALDGLAVQHGQEATRVIRLAGDSAGDDELCVSLLRQADAHRRGTATAVESYLSGTRVDTIRSLELRAGAIAHSIGEQPLSTPGRAGCYRTAMVGPPATAGGR